MGWLLMKVSDEGRGEWVQEEEERLFWQSALSALERVDGLCT